MTNFTPDQLREAVLDALYTQIKGDPSNVSSGVLSAAIAYLKSVPGNDAGDGKFDVMQATLEKYTNVMNFPNATSAKDKR